MRNTDNIIILNNKLFDIGRERLIMIDLLNKVQSIFPSNNLVKDNVFTQRPEPPKPIKVNKDNEEVKSFREILGDEIFISAEGKNSFKVNKVQKDDCNHDLNDKNNTLKVLPRRTMVIPDTRFCNCNICKENFEFVRNLDTQQWEDKNKM